MRRIELSFVNRDPTEALKLLQHVFDKNFDSDDAELHEMMVELYNTLRERLSILAFDHEYEITDKHGWCEIVSSKEREHAGYSLVITLIHKPEMVESVPQTLAQKKRALMVFETTMKGGEHVHPQYFDIVDSAVRGISTLFMRDHNLHVEKSEHGMMTVAFIPHKGKYALQFMTRSMKSVIDEEYSTLGFYKAITGEVKEHQHTRH